MPSEMVERAARAAYRRTRGPVSDEKWREVWAWSTDPYTTSRGGPWDLLQYVTATIAAIEDPTEAMLDRAVRVASATGIILTTSQAHDIWQAMVDEARAE